jgi:hypothetical protein
VHARLEYPEILTGNGDGGVADRQGIQSIRDRFRVCLSFAIAFESAKTSTNGSLGKKEKKMTTEPTVTTQEHQKPKVIRQGSGSDAVYGIGLIGAWVYFLRRATTTEERIQGFFKGLVWPAFLVYELFVFLEKK